MKELYPFYNDGKLAFHIVYSHAKGIRVFSNLPKQVLKDTSTNWLSWLEGDNPFFKKNRRRIIHSLGREILKNPRASLFFYSSDYLTTDIKFRNALPELLDQHGSFILSKKVSYSETSNQVTFYVLKRAFLLSRFYYPKLFSLCVKRSNRKAFEDVLITEEMRNEYIDKYDSDVNLFYSSVHDGVIINLLCEGFTPKMIIIL